MAASYFVTERQVPRWSLCLSIWPGRAGHRHSPPASVSGRRRRRSTRIQNVFDAVRARSAFR